MAERGWACERLPLSPLPLLIASHGEAEEAGRRVRRRINCTHSPHASRLLRPKGVPKPPHEDMRGALGRRESAPGPGHRSGGPTDLR